MKNKNILGIFSLLLIGLGIIIVFVTLYAFTKGEYIGRNFTEIKSDKIGQFGDLIGGIVGSMWALAGVLLFYEALKKQIDALENQKIATQATQDSISIQAKELKLQRKELKKTKKIFKAQDETLKLQQFESTFFNILNLLSSTLNKMTIIREDRLETKSGYYSDDSSGISNYVEPEYENIIRQYSGVKFFEKIDEWIQDSLKNIDSRFYDLKTEDEVYEYYYESYKQDLEPYLKILKQLLIKIGSCPFKNKQDYFNLVDAKLSSVEKKVIKYFNQLGYIDFELINILDENEII